MQVETGGEEIDEGGVRGIGLVGERAAFQPTATEVVGIGCELAGLGHQPGFAQPGLCHQREDAAVALFQFCQGMAQHLEFCISADQR